MLPIFGRIARDGLPTIDGSKRRSFGELVFAAFAELLKDQKKYPEAEAAFHIAMEDWVLKQTRRVLPHVQGLDKKIDTLHHQLKSIGDFQERGGGV